MEEDQFIPGNILFIDDRSIKTLNLETAETWLIAGDITTPGYREGVGDSARFNIRYSIHHRNATDLIVSEVENNCIRTLSRLTNETKKLVGLCGTQGNVDGSFGVARLGFPEKMTEIEPNVFAFNDVAYKSIRLLDLGTERVSTLRSFREYVYGLVKRPNSQDLIVSFSGSLGKVNLCNGKAVYLAKVPYDEAPPRDGPLTVSPFRNAIFSVRPETLYFLDENTMLTAGFHSHLVRVVDFASAYVTSICEASAERSTTTSGYIETCQLSNPRSLLAIPSLDLVIIGLGKSIGFNNEISGLPSNFPKMSVTAAQQQQQQQQPQLHQHRLSGLQQAQHLRHWSQLIQVMVLKAIGKACGIMVSIKPMCISS